VTYATLQPQTVPLVTELSGRTSPYMISDVRPQVSGIIQERLFAEGADVAAGEVLYQIDPALYQASYDSAKAALARAQANAAAAGALAQRYGAVVRVNAVSKQEYDNAVASAGQANAEVAAARAALETARINLEYTKVKAPVAGRIGRSTVTPGALVTQNQPAALATVQQLDPIYVDVTPSSTDMLKFKRALDAGRLKSDGLNAAKVKLKLEDNTPYANPTPRPDGSPDWIEGKLLFSDVTVEESTGAVTVRAVFPNPRGILLPGMYVRAIIEEGISNDTFLLPQQHASRDNRGRLMVMVLTKNNPKQDPAVQAALDAGLFMIEPRAITADRSYGNNWVVTGGILPGDKIQTDSFLTVRPGMPVRGVDGAAAQAAPGGAAPGQGSGGTGGAAQGEKK
jgi:membrane fusion protein (multidrug efflux system)